MKRMMLLLLLLSSALAYDPSANANLVSQEKKSFVSINADSECAVVQDAEVRAFCRGTCSVPLIDDDFGVYCVGYNPKTVKKESGPPYSVSPTPTMPHAGEYVQGQIKNQWGIPIRGVVTTFFGDFSDTAMAGDDGRFSINVDEGASLMVMSPAHDDYRATSPITTDTNVGVITIQTLNEDKFITYGIADYCSKTGCSCVDYGFRNCAAGSVQTCISEDDCCPSEGNCIEIGGKFTRVNARLSIDPSEIAISPGESGVAKMRILSNIAGSYTVVPQSLNFPVTLSSSQYSVESGVPSEGTITVKYPSKTVVKSDTVTVQLKYGSAVLDETEIVVGVLVPDADVSVTSCKEVVSEKTTGCTGIGCATKVSRLDCIFKVSNVGSFPINGVKLSMGGRTETLNGTIDANDYVYYKLYDLDPSVSALEFSYSTLSNTWTEETKLRLSPEKDEGQENAGLLDILSGIFKSIFG